MVQIHMNWWGNNFYWGKTEFASSFDFRSQHMLQNMYFLNDIHILHRCKHFCIYSRTPFFFLLNTYSHCLRLIIYMKNILDWVFYSLHILSKFWQQSGLHVCFLLNYCFLSNHNNLSLKASWIYFLWRCFIFCILVLRKYVIKHPNLHV